MISTGVQIATAQKDFHIIWPKVEIWKRGRIPTGFSTVSLDLTYSMWDLRTVCIWDSYLHHKAREALLMKVV